MERWRFVPTAVSFAPSALLLQATTPVGKQAIGGEAAHSLTRPHTAWAPGLQGLELGETLGLAMCRSGIMVMLVTRPLHEDHSFDDLTLAMTILVISPWQ